MRLKDKINSPPEYKIAYVLKEKGGTLIHWPNFHCNHCKCVSYPSMGDIALEIIDHVKIGYKVKTKNIDIVQVKKFQAYKYRELNQKERNNLARSLRSWRKTIRKKNLDSKQTMRGTGFEPA